MTAQEFQTLVGINPEHYVFIEEVRLNTQGVKQWTIREAKAIQKLSSVVDRFEVINGDDFEDGILDCTMKVGRRVSPRKITLDGDLLKVSFVHAFGSNVAIYQLAAEELQEEKELKADFMIGGSFQVIDLMDDSFVGDDPVNEVEGASAWWEVSPLSSQIEGFSIPMQWNGQSGAWVQNPSLSFTLDESADIYLPEVDPSEGIIITRGVRYTDDEAYFSMQLKDGVATEVETPKYHLRGQKRRLSASDFA